MTEPSVTDLLKNELSTRRSSRRSAIRTLGLGALGATGLGAFIPRARAQSATSPEQDIAILNFALNLEYLEAEYYLYAALGHGIGNQSGLQGQGTFGPTTVKANPRVKFDTRDFKQYAVEIARDELDHVKLLRRTISQLGGTPVAKPAIDLKNSFDAAAQAAGIGPAFDPFANEINFLLGAFVFEDVGVTAYKGAARLLDSPDVLEAAAGLLAVEAYHAGEVRTLLYAQGRAVQSTAAAISRLRDQADGEKALDQKLTRGRRANIVPTDSSGLAFSRSTRQVLNIVYLSRGQSSGGFFPNGMNGVIS
ncbi:MAG: ferritin-like domain-containing protein [Chthoniobacterales bacterium]